MSSDIQNYYPGLRHGDPITIDASHVTGITSSVIPSSVTKVVATASSGVAADYFTTGTNDNVQIQAAIDSVHILGGGTVFIKAGTYNLTAALTVYTDMIIKGDGARVTILKQNTTNAHGIFGSGTMRYVTIADVQLIGTGKGDGTGNALYIGNGAGTGTSQPHLVFKNVYAQNWGNDGFHLSFTFNSVFEDCRAESCGNFGFNIGKDGNNLSDGITMNSCFATGNTNLGYYIRCSYSSFHSCLAEFSGIGFWLHSSNIVLDGCGTENISTVDGTYNGTSYYYESCKGVTSVGCTSYDNAAIAFWVASTSKNTGFYNCNEFTVKNSPTASFQVDSSGTAQFIGCTNLTATSLATNTSVWIDSTQANFVGAATINGVASGSSSILVDPEGAVGDTHFISFCNDRAEVGYNGTDTAAFLKGTSGKGAELIVNGSTKVITSDAGSAPAIKIGTANTHKLGFYGTTPIVQAVLATGAAHSVDDVITALQALGLVKQS